MFEHRQVLTGMRSGYTEPTAPPGVYTRCCSCGVTPWFSLLPPESVRFQGALQRSEKIYFCIDTDRLGLVIEVVCGDEAVARVVRQDLHGHGDAPSCVAVEPVDVGPAARADRAASEHRSAIRSRTSAPGAKDRARVTAPLLPRGGHVAERIRRVWGGGIGRHSAPRRRCIGGYLDRTVTKRRSNKLILKEK